MGLPPGQPRRGDEEQLQIPSQFVISLAFLETVRVRGNALWQLEPERCHDAGNLPLESPELSGTQAVLVFMAPGPPTVSQGNCRGVEAFQRSLISAPGCQAGKSVSLSTP